MIDKPPGDRMDQEALYESHREKVVERLVWLKNSFRKDFHLALAVLVEAGYVPSLEEVDLADLILTNEQVADLFAEKFDVSTDKLLARDYISNEQFFTDEEDDETSRG